MDADIQPPVFVRYDNDGVIAFDTVAEAELGIDDKHFHRVDRGWDASGRQLTIAKSGYARVRIARYLERVEDESLGELLIRVQQPGCVTNLAEMSDEDLVGFSYQRLRLRTKNEMWSDAFGRSGCCGRGIPFGAFKLVDRR